MSATNPKTSITANEETDPFDLTTIASDLCLTITGATSGTVTPYYSNQEGTRVASDWVPDPTSVDSFPAGPLQLPFGLAKFVKFVGASLVGTAKIRFARGKNDRGDLVDVGIEVPRQTQVTS